MKPAFIDACNARSGYQKIWGAEMITRHDTGMRREDPAEKHGYLRYFYRDWRPTSFGRIWNGAVAWLSAHGLTTRTLLTLQIRNPVSGHLSSNVLVGVTHEGRQYIVSMLGDGSDWVKSLRATGGAAFVKRGRTRPIIATEIPASQRAPILKAWCQIATSGRQHLPVSQDAPISEFEKIAADYPVFRIDDAEPARSAPPQSPDSRR